MNNQKKPSVLVTGGTGFIGSHLIKRLLRAKYQVHALIRPDAESKAMKKPCDEVSFHDYDGSTSCLINILKKSEPKTVFHLASQTITNHKPEDLENIMQANILLGCQLLEGMLAIHTPYFINTGTFWQHFENKSYSAVNLYAATKQAFEDILLYYTESSPIRAITLKLFDVYGPHDPRNKLFRQLEECSRTGKELLMTSGEQLVDLVYVDDVAEAYVQAANLIQFSTNKPTHTSYAVSSGERLPLKKVVELYAKVIGSKLNIRWGGRPYRPREIMIPWTGTPLPNWEAQVGLETGMLKIHEHNLKLERNF